MPRRVIAILLAGLALTSGCRRQIPQVAPVPNTAGTVPQPLPAPTRAGKWSIKPIDQKLEYSSTRSIALRHITAPVQPADSFTTTVAFSITSKRTPSTTSYAVEIQSIRNTAAQFALHTPFSFSGHLVNNTLKIDALNGVAVSSIVDCSTPELSFAGLATQIITIVPAEIDAGATWIDSLSTTACTGPVPGMLSITRTYKALSSTQINGLEAIILELNEKTTLTGEGSQEQHRVQVHGTGSGKGQLIIDALTGAVISVNTDRLTLIAVTASGREQQFQQHVSETLVRIQ